MSLRGRVRERVAEVNELLDWLEVSDRFWSKQMHALEECQARSLGLTKTDFDHLYNKVLDTVNFSPAITSVDPLKYQKPRQPSPRPLELRRLGPRPSGRLASTTDRPTTSPAAFSRTALGF